MQEGISLPDFDNLGFRDVMLFFGYGVLLLIVLLLLRLFANLFIDICIMCDMDAARRTLIETRDQYIPFYRRRLVNPIPEVTMATDGDDLEASQVGSLLARLSIQDREAIIEAALPVKIATKEDLEEWWGMSDRESKEGVNDVSDMSTTTENVVCSICLLEIEVGNDVAVTNTCQHVFHHSCLMEWVRSNKNACPFCRSSLISRAHIETIQRR